MLVNILYRYRRQLWPLSDPGAELGHHHRVGAQIVKEVAIDRDPLDAHDLSQDLGEGALGARRRASEPALCRGWGSSQAGCQGAESFLHHMSILEQEVDDFEIGRQVI